PAHSRAACRQGADPSFPARTCLGRPDRRAISARLCSPAPAEDRAYAGPAAIHPHRDRCRLQARRRELIIAFMEFIMQLSDHLALENIVVDLPPVPKHKLLRQLADMSARQTGIDAGIIAKALLARENLGSTGIGRGIAIPHALIE